MGGHRHKHAVKEKGSQSKRGGHDTCAPHNMPLCCHSLTYLFAKGGDATQKLCSNFTSHDSIYLSDSIWKVYMGRLI